MWHEMATAAERGGLGAWERGRVRAWELRAQGLDFCIEAVEWCGKSIQYSVFSIQYSDQGARCVGLCAAGTENFHMGEVQLGEIN